MNIVISYPSVVTHYAPVFEDLFSPEGYSYFQKYLTGLILSDNKTVEYINSLFVLDKRNQSSFNRFMNRQSFDLEKLNERRVGLLQNNETTRMKSGGSLSGVLSLDDTLMSHYGRHFENIYRLYDHVNKHYTMAHNLVSLHYSDDKIDYPLNHTQWLIPDWEAMAIKMRELGIHINEQRWSTRQTEISKWNKYMRDRYSSYQYKKPELQELYKTKVQLGLDMLRRFRKDYPHLDLPVAMDGGYTKSMFCKILTQELNMAYVGSISEDHLIILSGSEQISVKDFLKRLKAQHENGQLRFFKVTVHYKGKALTYFAYCATHNIKEFGKQRFVISFKKEDLSDTPRFSISNRLHWHASGILRIRRHRWPIESFHQEGKAEGMDKYQLRHSKAINTHIAFVSTAFTMLKCATYDDELLSAIRRRLNMEESIGSLPFFRQTLQLEGLLFLIEYVHLNCLQGVSVENIVTQLLQSAA
jgi:DDE superfamily endonuclease